MSFLRRAINIIRSNINSKFDKDINIQDIPFGTQQSYEQEQTTSEQKVPSNFCSQTEKLEREYYANLELDYGSSFDDIKKKYRTLLKKYHPDKFHNDDKKRKIAERVVAKLNMAYNYFEEKYKKV